MNTPQSTKKIEELVNKIITFKRYPFITVWFVPYRNWHNLGAYRNKRNWYCRAWTGGNILGTKTYGVGLLGLQIMTGLKSVKDSVS